MSMDDLTRHDEAETAAEDAGPIAAAPASSGPYVSDDGAVMGRDFVIPGVDPAESDPYRFHTGRKRDHGGTDAIEVIDLVKQFGRARILNGLNLGLPEDQISMVLGPSGTGKSVLIKHIVGLLYPDSGDVLVHGESIPNMTDDELFEVRKKFGLLFQDGRLFGSMNIYDNTAFPCASTPTRARRDRRDRQPPAAGGGAHRGDLQDAERALRRDAQARRLRPGAGARTADRHVRRARLRPRPGPHGAALRADPRGPRGERRLLPDDQPRPQHRPPRSPTSSRCSGTGKIVESGPKEELFDSENAFVAQFLKADVTGPLSMD
jgi:phospholipid/cholesterol/gamma-HCH transport system ATP-binding protein